MLAAVLGALAGSSLARSYVGADSCGIDLSWDLNLAHSTEPDASIWPKGAVLRTTDWGPISFQSFEWLDAKVDSIRGEL